VGQLDGRSGQTADELSTTCRLPSTTWFTVCHALASESPSLRIRTDELRTVREAMRDFGAMLTELEDGQLEKLVLTQRNRVRAVVVSVERWSEVEQALEALDAVGG
jgi:hypothetical protein